MSDNNNYNKMKTFANITHIIFDLDGTLIDTELWGFNNLNTILGQYNKHCSIETYGKLVGMDTLDRAQHLITHFELNNYTKQTFLENWISECMKHLNHIELMPGVETLLENLKKHSIPVGIATVGKKHEFYAKTNHLPNVFEDRKYFQHIIHGDDQRVKRLKPFPDIYQICVSQFQPIPDPKNVLVFEDNSIGISSANAAGMTSVLVNDKRFSDGKDSKADLIIHGLEEFNLQLIGLSD